MRLARFSRRSPPPPRFRGIRHQGAWDADPAVLGPPFHAPPGLYASDAFRAGFRHLGELGLTFDAWVLEPQLDDVIDLARAFPDQPIVLDHCGTPLNIAGYRGHLHERFDPWREKIRTLAQCPNVTVKLGGLAMAFCGMPEQGPGAGMSSEVLAALWRPYLETCIEAFGPDRAMSKAIFRSTLGRGLPHLWNASNVAAGCSAPEKQALFAGTAARIYGLGSLIEALGV
jgi:predicted TIM-barrel fold metal-dependent hydrolase